MLTVTVAVSPSVSCVATAAVVCASVMLSRLMPLTLDSTARCSVSACCSVSAAPSAYFRPSSFLSSFSAWLTSARR